MPRWSRLKHYRNNMNNRNIYRTTRMSTREAWRRKMMQTLLTPEQRSAQHKREAETLRNIDPDMRRFFKA